MKTLSLLVLVHVLWLGHSAKAHAYLSASTPEAAAVLSEMPGEFRLTMTEGLELKFSTFKVYHLDVNKDVDTKELIAAAKALVKEVILLRNDGEARADLELKADESEANTYVITLKEGLAPGVYVVMWRVLSVDGHSTQDFSFFTFDPELP